MATHEYITYMWLEQRPDGKHIVSWDRPANGGTPFSLRGSRALDPKEPGDELTAAEFHSWTAKLCALEGFRERIGPHPPGGIRVDHVEIEAEPELPPDDSVETVVSVSPPYGRNRTLVVTATNTSDTPLRSFTVALQWENETPQPFVINGVVAQSMSATEGFLPDNSFSGTLEPRSTARFRFPLELLAAAKSRSVALSPDRYQIISRSGNHKVARIDGRKIGALLDHLD